MPGPQPQIMPGAELRARVKGLDLTCTAAAKLLGLTGSGLHRKMRGDTPVGRQTALLLQYLEDAAARGVLKTKPRRQKSQ